MGPSSRDSSGPPRLRAGGVCPLAAPLRKRVVLPGPLLCICEMEVMKRSSRVAAKPGDDMWRAAWRAGSARQRTAALAIVIVTAVRWSYLAMRRPPCGNERSPERTCPWQWAGSGCNVGPKARELWAPAHLRPTRNEVQPNQTPMSLRWTWPWGLLGPWPCCVREIAGKAEGMGPRGQRQTPERGVDGWSRGSE